MPSVKSVTISLKGKKEVYAAGDVVSGTWTVQVEGGMSVRGVRAYLCGAALAKWDESELSGGRFQDVDYIGKENYVNIYQTLYGKAVGGSGPDVVLEAGSHKYNFGLKLPSVRLPSSVEGEYGAIRYWVRLEIERPFMKFNINRYKCITVLDKIDINNAGYKNVIGGTNEKSISKVLGIGDAGNLTLTASIDRSGFCPGERIPLTVCAKNGSSKDLGKLKGTLIQRVKFYANGKEKFSEKAIRTVFGTPIKKGETRNWKNQLLSVDAIPPSTQRTTCHIINVSYMVKVFVEVPMGFDLVILLPITIGTVPQKDITKTGATSPTAKHTYRKCTHGFVQYRKSDGYFVNLDYVPMCTFHPNYVFTTSTNTSVAPGSTSARMAYPSTGNTDVLSYPDSANLSVQASGTNQDNGRAANVATTYYPTEPSAPPPPSYEEVMGEMNTVVVPEAKTETDDGETVSASAHDPVGFLVIRFPDVKLEEFRSTIRNQIAALEDKGGELICLSPQPFIRSGYWPARTSIAIFVFPSTSSAEEWFNTTTHVSNDHWLGKCEAFTTEPKEQFDESKTFFSFSFFEIKKDYNKELIKQVTKQAEEVKQLRCEMGGIAIAAAKSFKVLRGEWPQTGISLSLIQWESLEKFADYLHVYMSGKFNEYHENIRQIWNILTVIRFQSEDVSDLQPES